MARAERSDARATSASLLRERPGVGGSARAPLPTPSASAVAFPRSPAMVPVVRCLLGRNLDYLVAKLGRFAVQRSYLALPVLSLIEFGSFVDELHSIAQHAIHQTRQPSRHGLDCDGSSEPAA